MVTFETDLSGPEVIKLVSCSSQLSMKFSLLINMKMLTVVKVPHQNVFNFTHKIPNNIHAL